MDDLAFGTRDKRGDWRPNALLESSPVFISPFRPVVVLKWIFGYPGYFLPWNAIFILAALGVWFFLTPPMEEMKTFAFGWIAQIFLCNVVLVIVLFGALHLRLNVRRSQGRQFKYNAHWPDGKNPAFLFGRQIVSNLILTFGSGIPIWTAYQAIVLWAFANGYATWWSFSEHPIWLTCFMLLLPAFHDVHFFFIHRLIHWGPLYRTVHSVHHANVNPTPWSSLAMHPVEHLLYFSGVLIHLILPSHPLLVIYHLIIAGMGSVVGHIGFDKIKAGENAGVDTHSYAHYLHHKYFEVNYSDGMIPLDRWFGTWHDGSQAAEDAMNKRFMERAARRMENR